MASGKTRKSLAKRFKITKTGKVLRRQCGQNHFRAKRSSKQKQQMKKWVQVSKGEAKIIKQLIRTG